MQETIGANAMYNSLTERGTNCKTKTTCAAAMLEKQNEAANPKMTRTPALCMF